jgi:hypothetical protein
MKGNHATMRNDTIVRFRKKDSVVHPLPQFLRKGARRLISMAAKAQTGMGGSASSPASGYATICRRTETDHASAPKSIMAAPRPMTPFLTSNAADLDSDASGFPAAGHEHVFHRIH